MSSTDDQALRLFFTRSLVPAAEELRVRDVRFFPLGPDAAKSWYEEPPSDLPEFFEVESGDLEGLLREMWSDQGLPELARLSSRLIEIATGLEQEYEPLADVSPFMYVMY